MSLPVAVLVVVTTVLVVVVLRVGTDRRRLLRALGTSEAARLDEINELADTRRALEAARGEVVAAQAAARAAEASGLQREVHEALVAQARRESADRLLWALEQARARRTWNHDVAPFPGAPSPLDEAPDGLEAAVRVAVVAAHETSGIHVELRWDLPPITDPSDAVRLLRTIEETLAGVTKAAETVTLTVTAGAEGGTLVRVDAVDVEGAPVPIVLPADVVAALEAVGDPQVVSGRTLPS
ncbi:MAG: hypothetical protein ACKO91_17475 [Acidimicrobiales bacterium]